MHVMKYKRLLSLLLAGAMAASLAACGGQATVTNNASSSTSTGSSSAVATESTRPTEPQGQLIIGSTTQMGNDFYDPQLLQQRR